MKILLIIAIAFAAAAVSVLAAGPDAEARPSPAEVYARTMSPFCPGVTLRDCASDSAASLRAEIARKLKSGATNEQIDEWLVESFGPKVLGSPKGPGLWLTPLTLAAIGSALLIYGLRRMKGPPPEPLVPAAAGRPRPTDHEKALLESELRAFRRSTE